MRMRTIIGLSLGFVLTLVCAGVLPLLAQDGPSFSIVQPQATQKVTGTQLPIVIEFACDEDAPVVRFESYLDSTSLLWGRIRQPIARGHFRVEADLNEVSIKPGPHTLYIKLYDSKGRVAQREQRIILEAPNTVRADSTPPRVRIISPRDGQLINGPTDIKVDATDDESGVKWVMVFINNKMRAYMNEAPYVLPWNPLEDKELLGSYVIRARAADLFDNEGASLPVTVKLVQERTIIDDGASLKNPPTDPIEAVVFPVTRSLLPSLGQGADKWASNLVRPASSLPDLPGDLPLLAGVDLGRLPATADAIGVALLPVKSLPGLATTDTVLHADTRGMTTPAALAALPGLTRPALGVTPLTVAHETLDLPAELQAAARALPAGTALVAMLPVTEKYAPAIMTERGQASALAADTTRGVALAVPAAEDRPAMSAPSSIAQAGTLSIPEAPAARAQGRLPEMVLVALAPAPADKLNPRTGVDAGDLHVLQVARMIPVQPQPAEAGTRPAVAVPAAPSMRVLPDAAAVEKVGERGTLREQPVLLALLPTDGKQMPAMTTQTAIATAQGVRAQGPTLTDAGLLARMSHAVTPPVYIPVAVALLDGPTAGARTMPAAATDAPTYAQTTGKPAPANAVSDEALAMRTLTQHPAALDAGTMVARAAAIPAPSPYTATTAAALTGAVVRGRAVDQDTATVQRAGLSGKLTPAETARLDGLTLTPAQAPAGLAPQAALSAPAPTVAAAPTVTQPAADVVMDLEQRHTVKNGQTLMEIARVYATTPEELLKRNPGISPERPLPEGTALVVPGQTARIYVDDTPIADAPNPFIAQGHSMVPLRHIVEAKGGVVVWLPATREVNAWADNTFMGLQVGETVARINGDTYTLPVAPTIRQARAMVPLRYLMTALRLQVTYNPKTGTYLLVSQETK